MAFDFFGFKKKPVIEDVEVKAPVPSLTPGPVTFDEAWAAQEAASALPTPTPAPVTHSAPQDQVGLIKTTQEDVIAAYKIFLRRNPENQLVIESRLGLSREKILVNFITAKEFIKYPENINLILQTAKEMESKSGEEVVK